MISNGTIAACIATLFVGLVFPILCLLVYGIRNRKQGVWSAWLLGAAGFFVAQLLIRTPILNALAALNGFAAFSREHPWLMGVLLAVTAALFELASRLGAALAMRKRLTLRRAVAAGMGHGGIEAILLIGMTYLNNLVYIVLIRTGGFDALLSQTAAAGVDTSSLLAIRESLVGLSPWLFLLAGYERLLTMLCHTAMSVMVCYGVYRKRAIPWLLGCFGMHTLLDCTAGLGNLMSMGWSQNACYALIYLTLTILTGICTVVLVWICRAWQGESKNRIVSG